MIIGFSAKVANRDPMPDLFGFQLNFQVGGGGGGLASLVSLFLEPEILEGRSSFLVRRMFNRKEVGPKLA